MKKPLITLKVYKKGKLVRTISSRRKGHMLYFIQAKPFKDCEFFLCVRYSEHYRNEGVYQNKKDLIYAFKAFTEEDLVKKFL